MLIRLTHRFREQARSHRDFAVRSKSGESNKSKCGSELASEGAASSNVDLIDPPP